jgi:branched-chain amino acid transport system ATP-binding protein
VDIIEELERQHEEGGSLLERVRQAMIDCAETYPDGFERLRAEIDAYIRFQREHINLEESQILPLARRSLTDEDWEPINRAFLDNEDPLFGEKVREEFRDLQSRIVQHAPAPFGLGLSGEVPAPQEAVHHRTAPRSEAEDVLLRIDGLSTHYGYIQALDGVSLQVQRGQLVALVGANGAGKSTLLRTISGLQPATSGRIFHEGDDITTMTPSRRVRLGICQVPEGRQVFGPMSVEDNLLLGAYTRKDRRTNGVGEDLERMYEKFPILREKRLLPAGTLSGGQQQMLAIARALMGRPRLLLLDEPSMGLAPLLVAEIFKTIEQLREEGITIFLVEQNASAALAIADQGYVLETGRVVMSGEGPALLKDEEVQRAYLGI